MRTRKKLGMEICRGWTESKSGCLEVAKGLQYRLRGSTAYLG
ncbi:hypothetical protein CJF32_00009045 [Rutstroemia sp. NJR-2017a WRK4]|nr:hypothetical protein CJF32_00009045 [Rutstroemia sp. NJR-2017a WRK4]